MLFLAWDPSEPSPTEAHKSKVGHGAGLRRRGCLLVVRELANSGGNIQIELGDGDHPIFFVVGSAREPLYDGLRERTVAPARIFERRLITGGRCEHDDAVFSAR